VCGAARALKIASPGDIDRYRKRPGECMPAAPQSSQQSHFFPKRSHILQLLMPLDYSADALNASRDSSSPRVFESSSLIQINSKT
jgi:hypothetical protein